MLERFYANEDDELNGTDYCHYSGRLANDPEASVAVTGCPGSEDVDFTILSQHLNNSMFQWTTGKMKAAFQLFTFSANRSTVGKFVS